MPRFETAISARQQTLRGDERFPRLPPAILMVRPLVVSRKPALRMNSDRGDYLVYEVGSKEN
jgi:hypothetical protein